MDCDLLVRQATIYPGDGPPYRGDVAVARGEIVAVAPWLPVAAARELVEGRGLMLCPGFIDMHAHTAPAPVRPGGRDQLRSYLQPLEGKAPEPWPWSTFDEYLRALDATRPATTLVPSIGHNAVRERVMGSGRRSPSAEELDAMRAQVRLGFEAGARSLSFGLIYLPGLFADTEELVALAEVAARFRAPLVPHVRNEGAGALDAIGEMVEVARHADAPLHVSHLKLVGSAHLVEPLLELIDRAASEIDLSFDQYPYGAGSTILSALLPPWAQEGGAGEILQRLGDRVARSRMAADVRHGLPGWENLYAACGPENIVVANGSGAVAEHVGSKLAEIAEARRADPFEVVMDLLQEARMDVTMVDHYAAEETVRAIFRHPRGLIGSDGIFGDHPHPRLHGTAARVLGRYALREGLVPVEEAVGRLTFRAAERLGLKDRGRICGGLRADLVLLDPSAYVDRATYAEPTLMPPGVELVVVAGEVVFRGGRVTGARPGGVLRQALVEA
jgi:N-acyl-D-amino-acid deacylase